MAAQIFLNSLVAASEIALVGIGFALIYRTARFIHFAQAAVVAFGAYFGYALHLGLALPLSLSICLAVGLCSLVGAITELWVFRPLRRRDASASVLLLASLGLFIVGQNIISIFFGDDVLSFSTMDVKLGLDVLGARVSRIRALILGLSVVSVVGVALWLHFTRMGRRLRAVGNNPELAEICGVSTHRVIFIAFVVGSALAGIVGVLLALDTGMRPLMGVSPLIAGIVAVIVAGEAGVFGIAIASLLVATLQQLSVWYLGTQWHEATTFSILLVVLVFRPTGLFSRSGSIA